MNSKQKKLAYSILSGNIKGAIEWRHLESLLIAFNCKVIEGSGSLVKFIKNDIHLTIHRPHPNKEALSYRVKLVKEFLIKTGIDNEI